MSKERELIKDMKILLECTDMGGLQRNADVLIGRAIELLAQPEPEQFPLPGEQLIEMWRDGYDAGVRLAQLEQEPVAWFYERQIEGFTERTMSVGFEENFDGVTIPLYSSPPTRKPLSTKQAEDLWETTFKSAVPYYIFDEICVAIEQYHGIGVDDE